jgi:hypothetical protein
VNQSNSNNNNNNNNKNNDNDNNNKHNYNNNVAKTPVPNDQSIKVDAFATTAAASCIQRFVQVPIADKAVRACKVTLLTESN